MKEKQIKALCKITMAHCRDFINSEYGSIPKYGHVIADSLKDYEEEISEEILSKIKDLIKLEE